MATSRIIRLRGLRPRFHPGREGAAPGADEPIRLDALYVVSRINAALTVTRDAHDAQYEIVLQPDTADITPITLKTTDPAIYRSFQLGAAFYIDLTPAPPPA